MLKSAQSKLYNNKIEECGNDSKAVNQVTILPTHSSTKELADRFAKFFETKVSMIRAGFHDTNQQCDFQIPHVECSFTDFSPVTENELRSIVMKSPT